MIDEFGDENFTSLFVASADTWPLSATSSKHLTDEDTTTFEPFETCFKPLDRPKSQVADDRGETIADFNRSFSAVSLSSMPENAETTKTANWGPTENSFHLNHGLSLRKIDFNKSSTNFFGDDDDETTIIDETEAAVKKSTGSSNHSALAKFTAPPAESNFGQDVFGTFCPDFEDGPRSGNNNNSNDTDLFDDFFREESSAHRRAFGEEKKPRNNSITTFTTVSTRASYSSFPFPFEDDDNSKRERPLESPIYSKDNSEGNGVLRASELDHLATHDNNHSRSGRMSHSSASKHDKISRRASCGSGYNDVQDAAPKLSRRASIRSRGDADSSRKASRRASIAEPSSKHNHTVNYSPEKRSSKISKVGSDDLSSTVIKKGSREKERRRERRHSTDEGPGCVQKTLKKSVDGDGHLEFDSLTKDQERRARSRSPRHKVDRAVSDNAVLSLKSRTRSPSKSTRSGDGSTSERISRHRSHELSTGGKALRPRRSKKNASRAEELRHKDIVHPIDIERGIIDDIDIDESE